MLECRPAPVRWILLLLLTLLVLPVSRAGAETVSVVGMNGAPGTDGGLNQPGGDGEDGEDAQAAATTSAEDNAADATGGNGGDGGAGGPVGGQPGLPSPPTTAGGDGGDGGDARATAIVVGASTATASATGGDGGDGGPAGSDILAAPALSFSGLTPIPLSPGLGGDGGDAMAIARTNGTVDAEFAAEGGDAAFTLTQPSEGEEPRGPILATAEAFGGAAGSGSGPVSGGDARALAEARSSGHAEAVALAVGGASSGGARGGSASAIALAEGETGFAQATAATGAGSGIGLMAMNEAQLPAIRSNQAVVTYGGALPDFSEPEQRANIAFLTGDPLAADQARARMGNSRLDAFFAQHSDASMAALGQWRGIARANQTDPLFLTTEFEFTLSEEEANRDLVLAAFDINVTEEYFIDLAFELDIDGDVTTTVFSSAAEVLEYFTDALIDLGKHGVGDMIRARFDVSLEKRGRFEMGLALASSTGDVVPEPGTGLLVGLGLVGLALRRRRSN